MNEEVLELHVSDAATTSDSNDRLEALQLSLRGWPLFHLQRLGLSPSSWKDQLMEKGHQSDPVCLICGDSTSADTQILKLSCNCHHCNKCLTRLFTAAVTDESLYPPSCHRRPIPLNKVSRHLPLTLVRTYRAKSLELSTPNKVYCSNLKNGCNAFIAPHSIHNGQAFCQTCGMSTCVKCKEETHFGPCDDGTGNESGQNTTLLGLLNGLAKQEKWRVCPSCGRLVEKADGCNHILCRCGCDFCYSCGTLLDKCVCIDDDDGLEEEEEDEEYEQGQADYHHRHRQDWAAREAANVLRRLRSRNRRELEEDIIEDTMVAPFDLVDDDFTDR